MSSLYGTYIFNVRMKNLISMLLDHTKSCFFWEWLHAVLSNSRLKKNYPWNELIYYVWPINAMQCHIEKRGPSNFEWFVR